MLQDKSTLCKLERQENKETHILLGAEAQLKR